LLHETGRGRNRILDRDQHIKRDSLRGNEVCVKRVNQCSGIRVGGTIAVDLDDFGECTSSCWGNIHDLARRGKLKCQFGTAPGAYTAERWNGNTLRADETQGREQDSSRDGILK
jgi:hypothetical protein